MQELVVEEIAFSQWALLPRYGLWSTEVDFRNEEIGDSEEKSFGLGLL